MGTKRIDSATVTPSRTGQWDRYLDAELGFRNHWYPALLSSDVAESEVTPLTLLGEDILLKRIDGVVYAVQDRCAHRGFQFSYRPQCFTNNTITCSLHGFTYNLRNGELVTIPASPDSALIGKVHLRSYPVDERGGLIFMFVGDDTPPPLGDDLQPGFLDDDMYIVPAVRQIVKSNWRVAADTGFDPNHIFLHRNSGLLKAQSRPFPFGHRSNATSAQVEADLVEGPGPKGMVDAINQITEPVFETEFECDGETGRIAAMFKPDKASTAHQDKIQGSMWLPCGLKVEPWPVPGMTHFEWYVPIDERTHAYTIAWGKRINSDADRQQFREEVDTKWKHLGFELFNTEDVLSSEACAKAYGELNYWEREKLCEIDGYTISWRKLANKHNRGIQKRGLQ